jgi:hypothetical protein
MKVQILIASIFTVICAAETIVANGNSGAYTVEQFGQTVTAQANGSIVASGEGNLENGSGSVAATGDAKVNTAYGDVNIRGNLGGMGGINGDGVFVAGGVSGEASGPYGAYARGSAAGNAYVDFKNQNATVAGGVSGEAGALGYSANGAIDGRASGDLHGNFHAAGAVNGCLKHPDGTMDCFNDDGEYAGTIALDGSIVQIADRARTKFVKATKKSDDGNSDSKSEKSAAGQIAVGAVVFSAIAGITAFFF